MTERCQWSKSSHFFPSWADITSMLSLKYLANYNQSCSSASGLTSLKSHHLCRQITSYKIKFRPAALNIKPVPWGCNAKSLFITLIMSLLQTPPTSCGKAHIFHESSTSAFSFPPLAFMLFKTYFSHRHNAATSLCELHQPGLVKGSVWWHQQMCPKPCP